MYNGEEISYIGETYFPYSQVHRLVLDIQDKVHRVRRDGPGMTFLYILQRCEVGRPCALKRLTPEEDTIISHANPLFYKRTHMYDLCHIWSITNRSYLQFYGLRILLVYTWLYEMFRTTPRSIGDYFPANVTFNAIKMRMIPSQNVWLFPYSKVMKCIRGPTETSFFNNGLT